MPRASYGDRHCLTIQQDKDHVTLDFTSRVIDFFTVHSVEQERGQNLTCVKDGVCKGNIFTSINPLSPVWSFLLIEFDEPSALVVLLEEELVVIDLQTPGWPSMPTPYLAPLHSSAITCSCHISNVPPKLWERLVNAGKAQQSRQHTHRVRSSLAQWMTGLFSKLVYTWQYGIFSRRKSEILIRGLTWKHLRQSLTHQLTFYLDLY